jgi:hypothetical protein
MVDLCSSYESHPSLPAANKHVKKAMIFTREHLSNLVHTAFLGITFIRDVES